jgi:enediyne biosynthesis protein E4
MGINRKYLGFGVGFFDYDNDGWKDIFIANGHVYAQIAAKKLHLTYTQPRTLYRNLWTGRFQDVSTESGNGISARTAGRGCAFGDLDNDGDVDIVVNNLDAAPSLLRNDGGNRSNWLKVKCLGTRSNRSAIGARVSVTAGGRTQIDEVMSGSSYYSHNDFRLHFGLGNASAVEQIEVRWPTGDKEQVRDVPVNHLIVIEEGHGIVRRQPFGGRP